MKQAQEHFIRDEFEPILTLLPVPELKQLPPKQQAMGWLMLARAFKAFCQYPKAIHCAEKAIEHSPDFVLGYYELGMHWARVRNFEQAYHAFNLGSTLDVSTSCLQQSAYCLKELGYVESANAHYEACITRPCQSVFLLRDKISSQKQLMPHDQDFLDLKAILKSKMGAQERTIALYVWAKIMHQQRHFKQALQAITQANKGRGQEYRFSLAQCLERFDRMKTFAQWMPIDVDVEPTFVPVFIVGLSRTGKSTLESLLAQHQNIQARHESCFISDWVQSHHYDKTGTFFDKQKHLLTQKSQIFVQEYQGFMRLGIKKSKTHFIDTTPYHVEYVGVLHKLFPQAKFIYCDAEPNDLYWKIIFKYYMEGNSFSHQITDVQNYHTSVQSLMNHWELKAKIPFKRVQFEDMIHHPLRTVNEVLSFLGLDALHSLDFDAREHQQDIGFSKPYCALTRSFVRRNNASLL